MEKRDDLKFFGFVCWYKSSDKMCKQTIHDGPKADNSGSTSQSGLPWIGRL